jgi:predicted Rossmann fold flavoprotein
VDKEAVVPLTTVDSIYEVPLILEAEGVATKVEETGKIFPVSNRATDVLAAFMARLRRSSAELSLGDPLVEIERADQGFRLTTSQGTLTATRVVITTGGQSYPGCGTTGDGYRWATQLGHTLVPPRPALVPITTSSEWARALSGITIPDVTLRLIEPGDRPRVLDTRRGSLLFTHVGLSGPVVLDISRHVTAHPQPASLRLECDFLPNEKTEPLDERLRLQAAAEGKKHLPSLVPEPLPRRLAEALVGVAGLSAEGKAGELTKAARAALVRAIKQAPIAVTGTLGFAKAEVTAGGISLSEVDSRTMESKIVPGLYLAGEVLDLDGPIGGYNFQAAFSTGWLAGLSV